MGKWVTYRSSVNTRQKQDNTGIKRLCHRNGRITGIIDRTDAAKIPYVFHIKEKITQINYIKEEHTVFEDLKRRINRWCHRVCALPN